MPFPTPKPPEICSLITPSRDVQPSLCLPKVPLGSSQFPVRYRTPAPTAGNPLCQEEPDPAVPPPLPNPEPPLSSQQPCPDSHTPIPTAPGAPVVPVTAGTCQPVTGPHVKGGAHGFYVTDQLAGRLSSQGSPHPDNTSLRRGRSHIEGGERKPSPLRDL